MKNKIVFDLDGVLRDYWRYFFIKYGVPSPSKWGFIYKDKDKDIFDWVKYDNYKVLFKAPVTPYVKIIKDYFNRIEIWTNQPEDWKLYTIKWLNNNIKKYDLKYLSPKEKIIELKKSKNIYLVEDYPLFKDYNNIILIDTTYNRDVEAFRIHSPVELKKVIISLL